MISAFVLINCRFPLDISILEELKKLPSITNVYRTSGVYDIIVKISDVTEEDLRKAVSGNINSIHDVNGTVTMIIAQ
jgi:DNA-binding Lrp family transcriptional regulator